MRKKENKQKSKMPIVIGIGIAIIAVVVFVNYYLDQTKISGQRFGDQLAQIQTDLKNETQTFDAQFSEYKSGQISKSEMMAITDKHIQILQNVLPRYNELKTPELFAPSVQLFRLSTETQIQSDQALKEWLVSGDNSSSTKSDRLLQQSFQYEMQALQSYENAKSKGSQ